MLESLITALVEDIGPRWRAMLVGVALVIVALPPTLDLLGRWREFRSGARKRDTQKGELEIEKLRIEIAVLRNRLSGSSFRDKSEGGEGFFLRRYPPGTSPALEEIPQQPERPDVELPHVKPDVAAPDFDRPRFLEWLSQRKIAPSVLFVVLVLCALLSVVFFVAAVALPLTWYGDSTVSDQFTVGELIAVGGIYAFMALVWGVTSQTVRRWRNKVLEMQERRNVSRG